MKRLISIILSLLISMALCYAAELDSTSTDSASVPLIKIMLVNVSYGPGMEKLPESKTGAALNLAAGLSGKYKLISIAERDSLVKSMQDSSLEASALTVAERLQADRLIFININQLKNMLRVGLSSVNMHDSLSESRGVGYALIHYRHEKDDKAMYDPSLLEALQRAFAVAENDSMMFAEREGSFRVFPAPTLVVGGLVYQDNEDLHQWKLFGKQEVSSYDAVETIFEEARKSSQYVIYDVDSRDSLYAVFSLYGIENSRAATVYDLDALEKMEVGYFINGIFKRIDKGAEVQLYLSKIKNRNLDVLKKESGLLEEDDTDKFRSLLKSLTGKLLDIEQKDKSGNKIVE